MFHTKTTTIKAGTVFIASLLNVQHYEDSGENKPANTLVVFFG